MRLPTSARLGPLFGAVSLLLALAGAASAASQYVILSAEPPSPAFAEGRLVSVGERLDVPAGTVVTLMGEDGSVHAVPGPVGLVVTADALSTDGAAAPTGEQASTLSRLGALLSGSREESATLGAARDLGRLRGLGDPWNVDATASGPACIRDDRLVLARPPGGAAVPLSVEALSAEGGVRPALDGAIWAKGDVETALPSPLGPDEARLTVRVAGAASELTLHRLPATIDAKNPLDTIGWMMASGCDRQARAFARSVAAAPR